MPRRIGSQPALETHVLDYAQADPDQPLIISTPTGVSGAYDAPASRLPDHRGGAQIFAPVPRHPRPTQMPGSQRPTAERLEGQLDPSLLGRTPADVSAGLGSRMSSLNRRASRAGRSAAKNISDAKKQGWRPGRSRSKKGAKKSSRKKDKGRDDDDVMSQSAWTDVTWSTAGRDKHRNRRTYNFGGGDRNKGGGSEKDKKCVVM